MIPSRVLSGACLAVMLGVVAVEAQPTPVPAAPTTVPPKPAATDPPTKPDDKATGNQKDTGKDKDKKKEGDWPTEIGGKSLGLWISDFKDTDPTVREKAISTIPNFGPDARKQASKLLIAALSDPDPGVRIHAMISIGTMGLETEQEMKSASETLRLQIQRSAPGSALRLTAARTLAFLGPEAYRALSGVVILIDDPWWETRQAAAGAFGRIGAPIWDDKPNSDPAKIPTPKRPPSKLAMDKLMFEMLKDPSSAVRMEATQALLVLGPPYNPDPAGYIRDVKPYLDRLQTYIKTEKLDTIRVWLWLIEMMYDNRVYEANVEKIATEIGSLNQETRFQALAVLAVLGERAKPATGAITAALKDENPLVVVAALTTLVAMGKAGRVSLVEVEALEKTTKNEEVKEWAKRAASAIRGIKDVEPEKKDEAGKKTEVGKK